MYKIYGKLRDAQNKKQMFCENEARKNNETVYNEFCRIIKDLEIELKQFKKVNNIESDSE
jgi:hypothetical protein